MNCWRQSHLRRGLSVRLPTNDGESRLWWHCGKAIVTDFVHIFIPHFNFVVPVTLMVSFAIFNSTVYHLLFFQVFIPAFIHASIQAFIQVFILLSTLPTFTISLFISTHPTLNILIALILPFYSLLLLLLIPIPCKHNLRRPQLTLRDQFRRLLLHLPLLKPMA